LSWFQPAASETQVKEPIVIHTEEDYERVQLRLKELGRPREGSAEEKELQALAEAMLAWELRHDEAEDRD
jgi:hypothetical protein